jgi:hypothetical protein
MIKTYIQATIVALALGSFVLATGPADALIHIDKHGTNSYIISDQMSSVGSFDTTYKVIGERNEVRDAEDLIISTITSDYNSSAIIGYVSADEGVMADTTTDTENATDDATATENATDTTNTATLPSPFASPEQINERITSELRSAIGEAENNTVEGQYVEIKCDFGMSLEDMRCHYLPIPQTGQEQ